MYLNAVFKKSETAEEDSKINIPTILVYCRRKLI